MSRVRILALFVVALGCKSDPPPPANAAPSPPPSASVAPLASNPAPSVAPPSLPTGKPSEIKVQNVSAPGIANADKAIDAVKERFRQCTVAPAALAAPIKESAMKLELTVSAAGEVTAVDAKVGTGNEGLDRCLVAESKTIKFAAGKAGKAKLEVKVIPPE